MKKLALFLSLCAGLSLSAQKPTGALAAPRLLEKVTTNGAGKLVIPYEKYELTNGLTIVVHEDHSDPIAHVDVTYHVGSAREVEGRSGFAHFFEHMMFQGSEHVADEEHFKLVNEAGGSLNGTTNTDRTNYFETVPANYLELALWLEADRMGFLLDSVTQRKFEVQRATVKNERGQNYDNRPYGLVFEKISAAMYPQGHPYSWLTIGYIDDLNRVNVGDLKNFFLRWYGPNNAILTVAGDVKTAEVVKLAEKYFGSIPRGPEVKDMAKMPVTVDRDRYISYEDVVRLPQLSIARPGIWSWHEDEPALDALCQIIADGKSSVFYETFTETKVAERASMYSYGQELTGSIMIDIRPYPGHSLRETDSLLGVALQKFEKRGVTDNDLQRFKLYIESYFLDVMSSVEGKASTIASYATFQHNPNMIAKDLERYQKVTKEDVMRVYNKYIKGKPAVILSVLPKGKNVAPARPDNYTPPVYRVGSEESAEYKNLNMRKAADNFDRSKKPVPGPTPAVMPPSIWRGSYANGLKMIGTQSTEIPRTFMLLSISAGHRQEEPAKSGTAAMLAKMMDQSTEKYEAASIEEQLELLGSEVAIYSDDEEIQISITCLTRNLDATMALVEEKLLHPKFDQQEFELVKNMQLESARNLSIQPRSMASLMFNKTVYGANHIKAYPAGGTVETIAAITLEDLKQYHRKMISPNIARFVVVSDLNKDEMLKHTGFLEKWTSTGVQIKSDGNMAAVPAAGKTTIFLYDKPDAAQSEIIIGRIGLPYDAFGEYYMAQMMNYPLGGHFNSRINLNLRENKGWTYGARSGFSGTSFTGSFTASAGVKREASDSAVYEFVNEIRKYAENGITETELAYMKKSISQAEALRYEEPFQKLLFLKRIIDYNLPDDYTVKQNEILQNLTKKQVDDMAKKWFNPDELVISMVGDKAKIGDRLKRLGYNIVEVDSNGNPKPAEVKQPEKKPEPQPEPAPTDKKKKKKKRKFRGM
ncbi:MAG: insulinase family protein [Bacteroidetes bacterium]|nr:insulinase family protein [Bacteroidota bacterium]